MSAFTSKATGNWNATGQTTWNEVGTPGSGDTVTIQNTHTVTQTQAEASASITINAGGNLNVATYNQVCSGKIDVSGTLTAGASADTGITAGSIEFKTGCTRADNNSTKYNVGGDVIFPSTDVSTAGYGILTITGDGNIKITNDGNALNTVTINTGVTVTLTGNTYLCHGKFTMLGTSQINISTYDLTAGYWAGAHNGYVDLSADCDILGSGTITLTYNNSDGVIAKTSAFSFTGTVLWGSHWYQNPANYYIPAANFANANCNIVARSTTALCFFKAGTHKYKDFTITQNNNYDITVRNDTNNPDIWVYGNFVNLAGTGTYTPVWTKGNGTLYIGNTTNKVFAGRNLNFESIIKSGGGTMEQTSDCSATSFSGSAGGWKSSSAGTQRVMTVTNTGVCTGMTIKDMSFGAKDRINAKSGCTNDGNNKGIIFRDRRINVMM